MGRVVDVLRGSDSDKLKAQRHDELSTYGLLSDSSVGELRGHIAQLLDQGHLLQEGDRYPVLHVTTKGRELLRGEIDCELFRQHRPEPARVRRRKSGQAIHSWEGVDRELFEALRELRREIAAERKVPPYVIFHDNTLREFARLRPASADQLLAVYGVGEKKAEDLGPRFLSAIASHGPGGDPPDAPTTDSADSP